MNERHARTVSVKEGEESIRKCLAQRRWNFSQVSREALCLMYAIPTENLVSALTAHEDRNFGFGGLTNQVSGDRSVVGYRLIQVPHDLREQLRHIRLDHHLLEPGSVFLCDQFRESRVVLGLFERTMLLVKPNAVATQL